MKIQTLLGILTIGLLLISCKKELEPQESSDTPTTAVAQTPAQPNAATPAAIPGQQPAVQQVANPQMTTTMTGQPAKVAAGMNPAHGQPGHRCDIAVGAPLNSPPGKAPAQPMTITPGQSTQTATRITPTATATPAMLTPNANTAVAATAPGMNPAHGQPGHRCDIAVGAPLNSPPKAAEEKKAEPAKTDSQFTVSDPATQKKAE